MNGRRVESRQRELQGQRLAVSTMTAGVKYFFLMNVKRTSTQKTNAARFLDQMGIHYELHGYEVDPEDLAAEAVATKIGLPPEQLFKTLVAEGDRQGICMAVIPSDTELDLKALAATSGNRKIQLVPVGIRGTQILLAPKDFLRATRATVALFGSY
jgi:prolyl-tRNA editing enzyme YbaK/EbsC (Cys-tRNA(Pro) deacylase)